MPCAPPRWATQRNPSLPTDGTANGIIAAAMGTPLYPAQQYIVDVAGERLSNGRYRYPVVVMTMQRQTGKTVLARTSQVTRASIYERQRIYYTAQTGLVARKRWLDNVAAVEASPLGRFVNVKRGQGHSTMEFPNQSWIAPFPPTPESLHSESPHRVDVDELWSFDVEAGDDLITAVKPAQLTLRDRQLWLYSAAGDAEESAFMWSWILAGRAAASNPEATIAYFEWSAPDDADSYDPQTWIDWHPGIGHLIEVEDIADAVSSFRNRLDFDRAYLNRWAPMDTSSPIPSATWSSRHDDQLVTPDPGTVTLTFDVAPERADATVMASWRDPFGRPCVATIEHRAEATWLLERVPELVERHRPVAVAADGRGEARSIADKLRRAGVDVHELGTVDYVTACGAFLTEVVAGGLAHDNAGPLTASVAGARTRSIGDAWIWDQRTSKHTITPLRAATIGLWVVDHPPVREAPIPKARVVTLGR
jgi:hypothetical protein